MNREEWLTEIAKQLEPLFRKRGYYFEKYRLTCGWPCARALSKQRRIGECHSVKSSKSGTAEIFVSPIIDNSLEVAGVVMHEMVHVSVGVWHGHKGPFKIACRKLGLVGKPTLASPGKELNSEIEKLIARLGPYPHQALLPTRKVKVKQGPVSLLCGCGCRVYISEKWLSEVGLPTCACGEEFHCNA